MLHFLRRVAALAEPRISNPGWALIAPLFAMIAASIVAPTSYYFAIENHRLGSLDQALFWESLWPILVGALLAAVVWRWLERLPALPEGDIGAFVGRPFRLIGGGGATADRCEIVLRKWPVAAGALLVIAIMISGTGLLKP